MYYFLRGGLGNQLFIIGKALTDDAGVVDIYSGFKVDTRYKRRREYQLIFPNLNLKTAIIRPPLIIVKYLISNYDSKNFYKFSLKYYQATSNLLSLSELYLGTCFQRLTVHLRLVDYDLVYDKEHLAKIMKIVNDYEGPKYLITDDYRLANELFPGLCSVLKFEDFNSIDSWTFIANSSHVVTSDSSYSLSAAFIGAKKTIYHPKFTNIIVDEFLNHIWKKL